MGFRIKRKQMQLYFDKCYRVCVIFIFTNINVLKAHMLEEFTQKCIKK